MSARGFWPHPIVPTGRGKLHGTHGSFGVGASPVTSGTIAESPQPSTVGAVVVHYDAPEDLRRSLLSLRRADPGMAIVVVDNSETPGGRHLGREAASEVDARYVESESNIGFGRACNAGRRALGDIDFLFLLNQDAEIEQGSLAAMLGVLTHAPRVGVVSPVIVTPAGRVWFAGGHVQEWLGRVVRPGFGGSDIPDADVTSSIVTGCALMIRSDVWDRLGGFDDRYFLYFEDIDLSDRAREAGYELRVVADARAVHRREAGHPLRNLSPGLLEHSTRSRLRYISARARPSRRPTAYAYTVVTVAHHAALVLSAHGRNSAPMLRALVRGVFRRPRC